MSTLSRSLSKESSAAEVIIPVDHSHLSGSLNIPADAKGLVIFAHGSGSSRMSPRNQSVARRMRDAGLGTLLFDLLTPEEENKDLYTQEYRFDIHLLAQRLVIATEWLKSQSVAEDLSFGYFGASTGGAAALVAAAEVGSDIGAVVSRGGRPDLAVDALPRVQSPTLFIVGEHDWDVMRLNQEAFAKLRCEKVIESVPGATHLFEEQGALKEVARLAAEWFRKHLQKVVTV